MNFDGFHIIFTAAIGALGGVCSVAGIAKFFSNAFLSIALKNIDLRNSKEIEKFKCILGNKNYISKARFDTEFSVYRELSPIFFDLVKKIQTMIPNGLSFVPEDKEEARKQEYENYNSAAIATNIAQDTLYKNAPFIPEEFYNAYEEIISESKMQLSVFSLKIEHCAPSFVGKYHLKAEDYKRTAEIFKNYQQLNTKIRNYIATLDIID